MSLCPQQTKDQDPGYKPPVEEGDHPPCSHPPSRGLLTIRSSVIVPVPGLHNEREGALQKQGEASQVPGVHPLTTPVPGAGRATCP
jgi:hypothetical protein